MNKMKTKLIAMMMAGVMVFAMAPLGAGVAFAAEGDEGQPLCDAVNKMQNQMRQHYAQLEELKTLIKDEDASSKLKEIIEQMNVEKQDL